MIEMTEGLHLRSVILTKSFRGGLSAAKHLSSPFFHERHRSTEWRNTSLTMNENED